MYKNVCEDADFGGGFRPSCHLCGGIMSGGLLSGQGFCHKFAFRLGAHGKGVYSGRARTKKIQIPQNLRKKLCGRLT